MELYENYYTNNYKTFNEWYDLIKNNVDVYPRFRIPYKEWLDNYIENIKDKKEKEVKDLLRHLLYPFTRELDQINRTSYYINNEKSKSINNINKDFEDSINIEMFKRLDYNLDAWEGLSWVLELLPFHPYKAIKALSLYLESEIAFMPDDRIIGIDQCIKIIEAKFIYTNKGLESSILQLKPREFEWLIEILYKEIGYETILTPATRDGGKDIIGKINREDGKETVYVECKLYKTTELTIETVKAFGFSVIKDNINRGILFCTGYVNEELKKVDSRIQIWTLDDIIILLNTHIGSDWPKRLSILIESQKRNYKK